MSKIISLKLNMKLAVFFLPPPLFSTPPVSSRRARLFSRATHFAAKSSGARAGERGVTPGPAARLPPLARPVPAAYSVAGGAQGRPGRVFSNQYGHVRTCDVRT